VSVPAQPKIYHIVHIDRLASIMESGGLWSDAKITTKPITGTVIGIPRIKQRRLKMPLASHPTLTVGSCVPFYFCPRSVMLFLIYRGENQELEYHGGQAEILHLEADLHQTIEWAHKHNKRWAFTLQNASSSYFEDRADLGCLHEISWDAVRADQWSGQGIDASVKEGKQAEFLVEDCFPWALVERIGVCTEATKQKVASCLGSASKPQLEICRNWYY
jgi:hypothetical protein